MAGNGQTRSARGHEKEAGESMVLCPGCGGRGRFEWRPDDQVPRQWSWGAPCGMCDSRGLIPRAWLTDTLAARSP